MLVPTTAVTGSVSTRQPEVSQKETDTPWASTAATCRMTVAEAKVEVLAVPLLMAGMQEAAQATVQGKEAAHQAEVDSQDQVEPRNLDRLPKAWLQGPVEVVAEDRCQAAHRMAALHR